MSSCIPETRFSDRVANYIRYRPSYPSAVVAALDIKPGMVVADVGSGTGIFSTLLLDAGAVVHAVEPNEPMRSAAGTILGDHPRFHSVAGSAQDTTLAKQSIDLVVAAQAFHWFDPGRARTEFTRILKPEGRIALAWNERLTDSTPFLRDYEQLLLEYGTDYAEVRHERIDTAALGAFFHGPFTTEEFANEQRFDFAGLAGRLLSCSYSPAEGTPGHEPMMAALRRLFDQHQCDGRVTFVYATRLYLGR